MTCLPDAGPRVGGAGVLSSGEGFGPDQVGVSGIGRQDLKPEAIAPGLRPVDADAVHCHLLASPTVRTY